MEQVCDRHDSSNCQQNDLSVLFLQAYISWVENHWQFSVALSISVVIEHAAMLRITIRFFLEGITALTIKRKTNV